MELLVEGADDGRESGVVAVSIDVEELRLRLAELDVLDLARVDDDGSRRICLRVVAVLVLGGNRVSLLDVNWVDFNSEHGGTFR